jgi:lysine 2,3-aminomutase
MAQIGSETLFLGARPPRVSAATVKATPDEIADFQKQALQDQWIFRSIVSTGSPAIARLHETRVAIDVARADADLAYVRNDERITDVILASKADTVDALFQITELVKQLKEIPHVNAVRLRSLRFNYTPERYTPAVIDRLADLCSLTLANPLRLEIETQFIQAAEFRPEHAALVRRLNNRGITVYCNTPLLGGVNNTADEIHELAYRCRRAGIEFHHLYVAGLPVQDAWNPAHPVALDDVIDIATCVRREGSGREIPRYIIRTTLGEVDFGLNCAFVGTGTDLAVKLMPYTRSYFRAMQPDFNWPDNVEIASDGKPVVPVAGLQKSTDFALA